MNFCECYRLASYGKKCCAVRPENFHRWCSAGPVRLICRDYRGTVTFPFSKMRVASQEDAVSFKKWHPSHHELDVLTDRSSADWLLRIAAFE